MDSRFGGNDSRNAGLLEPALSLQLSQVLHAASPGSAGIYLPAADDKTDIYLPVADNKIDIARLNNRGPSARCGQDARAPRNGTTCLVGPRRSLASNVIPARRESIRPCPNTNVRRRALRGGCAARHPARDSRAQRHARKPHASQREADSVSDPRESDGWQDEEASARTVKRTGSDAIGSVAHLARTLRSAAPGEEASGRRRDPHPPNRNIVRPEDHGHCRVLSYLLPATSCLLPPANRTTTKSGARHPVPPSGPFTPASPAYSSSSASRLSSR